MNVKGNCLGASEEEGSGKVGKMLRGEEGWHISRHTYGKTANIMKPSKHCFKVGG
jgi:hypothetical protein